MSVKKLLADFLASLPDDDAPEPKGTDIDNGDTNRDVNQDAGNDAPKKPDESENGSKEFAPAPDKKAEVDAPSPAPEQDKTIINAADMVDSSVDMRLSAFYTKQQQLEETVKILLSEVNALKVNFDAINSAIDVAAKTSPEVASIDTLINML